MKDSESPYVQGALGRAPFGQPGPAADAALEVAIQEGGAVTVAVVAGSLDALTAEALETALEARIREGQVNLVLDLTGVAYTSSAGLGAMLLLVKEARRHGGDVRLAGVQPRVRRVLEMSGFTSFMKLFPDAAGAAASYGTAQ
ncbi:STAS domain-containing protein [Mesoterricola sediminis]|uniref:Anti-sigma factor antagonist n=1 Tax=Mesoterricola sediminis TaxID=2927980 RepID=A0AA48GZP2_9BACT|nr:STAS domain-containing protein [Mesoterricola sediminis]BDU77355.1 hypothetical protein METESE_23130 [Mesoterricola sediminis]